MQLSLGNWYGGRYRAEIEGSFCRGSFRKGVRVPIIAPRGGIWVRVQLGGLPVVKREKGKRVGSAGGVVEPASQCACVCQNHP